MMHIKNGSLNGIKNDIVENDGRIVIFGMGVIGATVAPAILCQLGLIDRLVCFIDNDRWKWNTRMRISGKDIPVLSPNVLAELNGKVVILLSISRYADAMEQLRGMGCTKEMDVYLVPMLCISNFCDRTGNCDGMVKSENTVIPKKIHYMWLGQKKMPDALLYCIESWKKYCPDYEIIRWDESNYDVHKNVFMSEAYHYGRYGFIPDYARLDILYRYGGIYMDTDVELLRSLDDLLYQEAFCGVEKWQVLNFGACSGAIKGHKSLKPFLERWERRRLVRSDGTLDVISSGQIDTSIAIEMGYEINGKCQNICGMNVYPSDFFNPYDYMTGITNITKNTYSVHHFNGGWLDEEAKKKKQDCEKDYREIEHMAEWVG